MIRWFLGAFVLIWLAMFVFREPGAYTVRLSPAETQIRTFEIFLSEASIEALSEGAPREFRLGFSPGAVAGALIRVTDIYPRSNKLVGRVEVVALPNAKTGDSGTLQGQFFFNGKPEGAPLQIRVNIVE